MSDAESPLSENARNLARLIMARFGAPAELLTRPLLKAEIAKLKRYLLVLELLVRRVLLALAQTLAAPQPIARAPGASASSGGGARTLAPPDPQAPSETWPGVSFALGGNAERSASQQSRERKGAIATHAPVPPQTRFAKRLEAAIRVLLDPSPHAQRLARRLSKAPTLARRIANARPPHRGDSADWYFAQPESRIETAALSDTS